MKFADVFAYLKKNYVIALSGTVVLACLLVHFVRSEQITRLEADADDLNVRRTRILRNLKHGSEIEKDLADLKAMESEVEARLFVPEDLATNQRYFYKIENATGVQMTSIQQIVKPLPQGKKNKRERMLAQKAKYQELVYDMSVTGTYSELLAFLREIEGGKAFAVLDGISIATPGTDVVSETLNMRLSVNVLARKS